jgi:uncharacterized membrane protein YdjX (TVP38/TMEM64 family)
MDEPPPSLRPLAVRVIAGGILFLVAPLALVWAVPGIRDPVAIREWVLAFGPLAPVVLVALQVLQVLVAPVPGQALAVVGGYLFGPLAGTVYSLVGTTIGSAVAFTLSRRFGRPYVTGLVGEQRLARFDAFLDSTGVVGVFVLFLVPGPWPDDAVCFVAGVSAIRIPRLVAAAVLGRGPSILFASVVGAQLASRQFVLVGAVLVVFAVMWVVAFYHRRRLLGVIRRYAGE